MTRPDTDPITEPWMADGLCAQVGPGPWDDEMRQMPGQSVRDAQKAHRAMNEAAKALCARCPVASECLDYATRTDARGGIYAGLTYAERVAAGCQSLGVTPRCGSDAGYYAHTRADLPACEPCRDAHAEAGRARYARRQAVA